MNEHVIKSRLLLFIYKNFDALIRFAYTRIPVIRDIAQRKTFNLLYRSSHDKVYNNYISLKDMLKKNKVSLKGKSILEVGPGTSLILAMSLLADGAKKIYLLDRFPRWDKSLIEKEVDYLENEKGKAVSKFLDDNFMAKPEYIEYIQNSLEEMNDIPDESIDCINSFGVLEHIRDMSSSFQEMKRVLVKGGVIYHYISLGDHYNFLKPLGFLKYSDFTWRFLTKEGYSYTNRLRIDDYLKLAEENNIKIIDIENELCDKSHLKKINKKFQHKRDEDIMTTHSYLLGRK